MSPHVYFIIMAMIPGLITTILILSQKSEGSSLTSNAQFKARGAKSLINVLIVFFMTLFIIVLILHSLHIKREYQSGVTTAITKENK